MANIKYDNCIINNILCAKVDTSIIYKRYDIVNRFTRPPTRLIDYTTDSRRGAVSWLHI